MRCLILLLSTACVPTVPDEDPWLAEVVFQAPAKLGSCAVGDVDPRFEGAEIVATCVTGDIYVVHREGEKWVGESVFDPPVRGEGSTIFGRIGKTGEMIQCAVGDVRPDLPGLEIVVVGMIEGSERSSGPGAAWCLYRTPDGWERELIRYDPALLHAVCVVKQDVFVAGFEKQVYLARREEQGWAPRQIVSELPGAAKNAIPLQDGVALACNNGSIVVVRPDDSGWKTEDADWRDAARGRIATDGKRLLSADDDGVLTLIDGEDHTVLHRSSKKLRGAVLADLDPTRAGLEVATTGYDGKIVIVVREGDTWKATTVFSDPQGFHHLASGELDGEPGDEVVACGYSGRIVMVTRR